MEKTYMSNEEKRQRLNRLDNETWMRWAYVPFCVAEGAWDYADTVVNISAQMKLTQTKKLCRAIRELKRSYDSRRQRHAMGGSGHELENFQVLETVSSGSFKYMCDSINESTAKQYPELDGDYRMLLTAVYSCITVLDVLYKYMDIQEAHVRKVCGFAEMSSILPQEVHALRKLIPEFIGDKPVKVKGRGLFVHNIVKGLCGVKLTEVKEDTLSK